MGKKKATQLKPETKQLFEEHIEAATSAPNATSLFTIDTVAKPIKQTKAALAKASAAASVASSSSSSAATKAASKKKKVTGNKRKHEQEEEEAEEEKKTNTADKDEDDEMDTSDDAAAQQQVNPFADDSDDEPTAVKTYNRTQRTAHKQGLTQLVSARESKRLKTAKETKAQKEAAVTAANPQLFDLWATTLEQDIQSGIIPSKDAKGFRTGRTKQTRFRHAGAQNGKSLVLPSTLPQQIEEGASFHPDYMLHQGLLNKAYELDEKEREEKKKIQARFNVKLPEPSAEATAAAAAADDSWIDDDSEVKKNPATTSVKYSKTQRNKLAQKAVNRAKHEAEQDSKEFAKIVKRIPVMVAAWKKEDKLKKKEKERVKVLKETQNDRKPRLSRYEEQEQFPDVALTEELPERGALRTLKPSSHILEDQFARFQQRHLIETRKRVKRQAVKNMKSYERFKEEQPMTAPQAKKLVQK